MGQFSLDWDTLAVVDALAGGDKTRWDYFYLKSWGEVNTMIEMENHKAYYRYQVMLKQEQLQKR